MRTIIFIAIWMSSEAFNAGTYKSRSRLIIKSEKGLVKDPPSFLKELEESFRKLGAEHNLNKVIEKFNVGAFKRIPIFGRLEQITLQPITLSELSSDLFPDISLGPLELNDDGAFVFKGDTAPFESTHDNLYAVQSTFKILTPKEIPGLDSWIPTEGVCTTIGAFRHSSNYCELLVTLDRVEVFK
jgi:hypothetical protein